MFLSSFFFLLSSNSFNFASLLCIIVQPYTEQYCLRCTCGTVPYVTTCTREYWWWWWLQRPSKDDEAVAISGNF